MFSTVPFDFLCHHLVPDYVGKQRPKAVNTRIRPFTRIRRRSNARTIDFSLRRTLSHFAASAVTAQSAVSTKLLGLQLFREVHDFIQRQPDHTIRAGFRNRNHRYTDAEGGRRGVGQVAARRRRRVRGDADEEDAVSEGAGIGVSASCDPRRGELGTTY